MITDYKKVLFVRSRDRGGLVSMYEEMKIKELEV